MGDEKEKILIPSKNYLFVIALDEYEDKTKNLDNVVRGAATVVHYLTEYYTFYKPENAKALHVEEDGNIKKFKNEITDIPIMEYRYKDEIKLNDLLLEELEEAREKIQTYTLFNENATIGNYEKHLNLLLGDDDGNDGLMTKHDNLFIYFTGHGSLKNKVLRLHFYDDIMKPWELSEKLNAIEKSDKKPKHVFFVIDACNSGQLNVKSNAGFSPEKNFSRRYLTSTHEKIDASGGVVLTPFAASFIRCLNDLESQFNSSKLYNKIHSLMAKTTDGKQLPKYGSLPGVNVFSDFHFPFKIKGKFPLPITFKRELMKLNYTDQSKRLRLRREVNLNRLLLITIHADCQSTLDYIYQFIFHRYIDRVRGMFVLNPRHRIIRLRLGIVDNREKLFHNQLGIYLLGARETYNETGIIKVLMDCMREYNVILLCDFEDYSNEIYIRELTEIRKFLKRLSTELSPSLEDGIIENGLLVFVRDKTDNSDLYQANNNLKKETLDTLNFNYCHTPMIQNIEILHICDWWNNNNSLNPLNDLIHEHKFDNYKVEDDRMDLNETLRYITSKIGYEGQALVDVMNYIFNNPNILSINFDEYE